MVNPERNEYFEALRIIAEEQGRRFPGASLADRWLALDDDSAPGELSREALDCLRQAVLLLSGTDVGTVESAVPDLARAAALIVLELTHILEIRRRIARGELIQLECQGDSEGDSTSVPVYRVTNPLTGRLAGLATTAQEASMMLHRFFAGTERGLLLMLQAGPAPAEPRALAAGRDEDRN